MQDYKRGFDKTNTGKYIKVFARFIPDLSFICCLEILSNKTSYKVMGQSKEPIRLWKCSPKVVPSWLI